MVRGAWCVVVIGRVGVEAVRIPLFTTALGLYGGVLCAVERRAPGIRFT